VLVANDDWFARYNSFEWTEAELFLRATIASIPYIWDLHYIPNVTWTFVFAADPLPFTNSQDCATKLDELNAFRASGWGSVIGSSALAMMYGRSMGTNAGCAWLRSLCFDSRAVIGPQATYIIESTVLAHEIAHIVGVWCHDGAASSEGNCDCTGTPGGYIMSPYVSAQDIDNGFSYCSESQIYDYTGRQRCLLSATCGDFDQDGIRASDALKALLAAVAFSPYDHYLFILDVNRDGLLTASDALYILEVAVGLLPEPWACGV